MTHDEFAIGEHFTMYDKEYRCVDKGRFYIIAAEITDIVKLDPSWLNGPAFAVAVTTLDAYDIPVCEKIGAATRDRTPDLPLTRRAL